MKSFSEKMIKNIDQFFADFVKEHNMINQNDKVIIGVSGGADSVCLLFLMHKLSREIDFEIIPVHVNHMLRGSEADRDAEHANKVCSELGLRCINVNVDVKGLAAKKGLSIEEAGRKARYQAFEAVSKKLAGKDVYRGGKVAVAHHRDDNVETVLLNLVRGSNINGIKGILPVTRRKELMIIRPMLCMGREDIEHYLNVNDIEYVTDSTNLQSDFARNRIRLNVLPELKEINSKASEHINETAQMLSQIQNYMDKQVAEAMSAVVDIRDEASAINVDKLGYLDPALQSGIVYKTITHAAGTAKDISRINVRDVISLCDKQTGRRIELPYGLVAMRGYTNIIIRKGGELPEEDKRNDYEQRSLHEVIDDKNFVVPLKEIEKEPLSLGTADGGAMRFSIVRVDDTNRDQLTEKNQYTKAFDYDKIKGALILSKAQPDDEIRISVGTKTLRRFFIDQKISRDERENVLVLKDMEGVLWIIGYRIGVPYMITDQTTKALVVEIIGGDNEN